MHRLPSAVAPLPSQAMDPVAAPSSPSLSSVDPLVACAGNPDPVIAWQGAVGSTGRRSTSSTGGSSEEDPRSGEEEPDPVRRARAAVVAARGPDPGLV